MTRSDLVRKAFSEAIRLRARLGYAGDTPICPIDLALKLDIDVRFGAFPFEGMYYNAERPQILLTAERPSGRIAFTAGHELGHHVFGHGTAADLLLGDEPASHINKPEEFLADCFSGALLMPKTLVLSIFHRRGVPPQQAAERDVYVVAGVLGVGYGTLVNHLARTLGLIDESKRSQLARAQPKKLRLGLIGEATNGELFVVDEGWNGRPLDLQVGDWVLAPADAAATGGQLQSVRQIGGQQLFRAAGLGLGNLTNEATGWATFVRVARRHYVGLAEFRHLEDPDEDDEGTSLGEEHHETY